MPKLSFQIAVRNNGAFVADAVRSLAAEPFADREILAVDDASEDDSFDILKRTLAEFPGLKSEVFRNETRLGIAKTRQRLVEATDADYIAPFDGDDLLIPGFVKEKIDFLEGNPTFAGAYGRHIAVDETAVAAQGVYGYPFSRMELAFSSVIGQCGMVLRRSDVVAAGGYLETGLGVDSLEEDQSLWMRLAALKDFKFFQRPAFLYRMHAAQVTKTKNSLKAKAHQFLCDSFLEQRKGELAAILSGIAEEVPKREAAMLLAVLARGASHHPESFAKFVSDSYAIDPNDYGTLLRLQAVAVFRGDFDGAVARCDELLNKFPNEPTIAMKALQQKISTLEMRGLPFAKDALMSSLNDALRREKESLL